MQLYEDNPGALSRDYALLQLNYEASAGDHAPATLSGPEAPAPADSIQAQDQGSGNAAPVEHPHNTAAAAGAPDARNISEGSIAASEAASMAVNSHLIQHREDEQSVSAAPRPSASTTARDASASASDELPIRRLQFSSVDPDAASLTSTASTSLQQASATAAGGLGADMESTINEDDAHVDGVAAKPPQQRGRRLWGVWSLLRRGKHADGERTAPHGVAGSADVNAGVQPEHSSGTASVAQLPVDTAAQVATADGPCRSGHEPLPASDQPGTTIVHAMQPAAGWLPERPVSKDACALFSVLTGA